MIGPLLLRNGIRRLFCISAVGASLPCLPLRNVNFGSDYDDGYAFDVQIHELQVQKHLRHAPEVKKDPKDRIFGQIVERSVSDTNLVLVTNGLNAWLDCVIRLQ